MRVFVTGGTGFVGSALTLRLLRDGHDVSIWTRRPEAAPSLVGGDARIVDANGGETALLGALERADAVINLAGESVVSRWTDARKEKLRSSRVDLTQTLVRLIRECDEGPSVFISTSAVGFYGSDLNATFDESSPPADDFLARLCVDWENAALKAESTGARVCLVRVGLVLGDGGGALASMLPVFKYGFGGRLGSGRQWMSWIQLDDLVEIYARALTDPRYQGPINGVGPEPVTNREFTRTLGRVLRRPTVFPVPSVALKLLFGEGSRALLASQRVDAGRLRALGFEFRYSSLESALRASTYKGVPTVGFRQPLESPDHPYLRKRGARYLLEQHTEIDAPLDEVFPFFSEAANLGALTPPDMEFRILNSGPISMAEGTTIDYRITLGPVPMRWRTVIESWNEHQSFVDAQHEGPYRSWFHEHEFEAIGDKTKMIDRVWYSLPFGVFGRLAHGVFVRSMLHRIFEYRATRIRLRFGARELRRDDLAA